MLHASVSQANIFNEPMLRLLSIAIAIAIFSSDLIRWSAATQTRVSRETQVTTLPVIKKNKETQEPKTTNVRKTTTTAAPEETIHQHVAAMAHDSSSPALPPAAASNPGTAANALPVAKEPNAAAMAPREASSTLPQAPRGQPATVDAPIATDATAKDEAIMIVPQDPLTLLREMLPVMEPNAPRAHDATEHDQRSGSFKGMANGRTDEGGSAGHTSIENETTSHAARTRYIRIRVLSIHTWRDAHVSA